MMKKLRMHGYTTVKLKIKDLKGKVQVIDHEIDLFKLFPEIAETEFDTSMYKFILNTYADENDISSYDDLSGY